MALRCGKLIGMAISRSRTSVITVVVATGLMASANSVGAQSGQSGKARALTQGEAVGLNPQPEPPSKNKKKLKPKPAEMRGLNPQPEPPKPPSRQ